MGIITLTDRISVSVRAKNDSQSNSQKRDTGKNIANALTSGGSANISDTLADELGNTSKPTITDEQGREWVAMSDIITAGKKMQQEGAFDEKTTYRYGNVACIRIGDLPKVTYIVDYTSADPYEAHVLGPLWVEADTGNHFCYSGGPYYEYTYDTKIAVVRNNNRLYFLGTGSAPQGTYMNAELTRSVGSGGQPRSRSDITDRVSVIEGIPVTDVGEILSLDQYGDYHEETTGGSLIDWTKSDAEIEEDIRNLYETWDVTEHAGSVNANGTYVLAGPIEFNPGD